MNITARVKAFEGEGARNHALNVVDGEVRVYDSVAGHYTTCHSISPRAQKRIVRLAEELSQ